jgi:glycerophosphoryl diester phosphodiesterase
LEAPLVRAFKRANLDKAPSPVFIQSFELTDLLDIRVTFKAQTKLVFLTGASGAPTTLVADAHAAGALVHPNIGGRAPAARRRISGMPNVIQV